MTQASVTQASRVQFGGARVSVREANVLLNQQDAGQDQSGQQDSNQGQSGPRQQPPRSRGQRSRDDQAGAPAGFPLRDRAGSV